MSPGTQNQPQPSWGIRCTCFSPASSVLGVFSFSPPSHPFPSPASCLELQLGWGSPWGEVVASPSYLRVVRFKGIAVIR